MPSKFEDPELEALLRRLVQLRGLVVGELQDPDRAKYEASLYALECIMRASKEHTLAMRDAAETARMQSAQTALFISALAESSRASSTLSERLFTLNIILVIATIAGSIGTIMQAMH